MGKPRRKGWMAATKGVDIVGQPPLLPQARQPPLCQHEAIPSARLLSTGLVHGVKVLPNEIPFKSVKLTIPFRNDQSQSAQNISLVVMRNSLMNLAFS